jgi:hypothetical protein
MSNHHKAKFTFSDASNLKALDIPGIVAKRSGKKHLDNRHTHHRNREVRNKKQSLKGRSS